MSRSEKSIWIFAIYMLGMAAAFVIAPNRLLTLFGFAETDEVWVRILGYMVGAIAFFYFMAVKDQVVPFFRWTVYARVPILPLYTIFVANGIAPQILLLFGAIDLLGAIWTWWALRCEQNWHDGK